MVRRFALWAGLFWLGCLLYSESGPPLSNPPVDPKVTWDPYASVLAYWLPEDKDYLQPTVTLDRARFHLEARYNYEDRETLSLWLGANVQGGNRVVATFTPMLGGVFGQTQGVAPGYRFSLEWDRFDFSSEGEYLIDAEGSDNSYFYTWSEAAVTVAEGWRVGVVGQRTRAFETTRELERGFLLSGAFQPVDFGFYLFNPDQDHPYGVLSVGAGF